MKPPGQNLKGIIKPIVELESEEQNLTSKIREHIDSK